MRVAFVLAIGLALLLGGAARAQDSYPNMLGTWVGKGEGIFVSSPGARKHATFSSVDITVVINQQEDRRFGGTITMAKGTQPIVGVITDDGGVWWTEPGGFVEGRLTDPDTFEGCYLRATQFSQLAACEVLKRQK
ncbi:MAG: hypothetical protein AAF495_13075 [Pseudomonadota bacterium]